MWLKDKQSKRKLKSKSNLVTEEVSTKAIIRVATIHDVPGLLPLMDQLGYAFSRKEFQERFNDHLCLDGYGVAVACLSDKIVGCIAWSSSNAFVSGRKRIHLEELIVGEKYRGQGIGRKLICFVEKLSRQSDSATIDVTAIPNNGKHDAYRLYKGLGYHNERLVVKQCLRNQV